MILLQYAYTCVIIMFMTRENAPQNPELFVPGLVIELSDMTELAALEDMIAPQVDPTFDRDKWIARPLLKEILRPKVKGREFNGKISDISLRVMENPYEQLLSARDRGLIIRGGTYKREKDPDATNKYVGLEYNGTLNSTGRGAMGSVSAEVWYAPIGRYARKDSETLLYHSGYTGDAIHRIVSRPEFDPAPLEAADLSARHIGFKVLQEAMIRPISVPMRD